MAAHWLLPTISKAARAGGWLAPRPGALAAMRATAEQQQASGGDRPRTSGVWLSATVRLSTPPTGRNLRDRRIALRNSAREDLPMSISSLQVPRGQPAAAAAAAPGYAVGARGRHLLPKLGSGRLASHARGTGRERVLLTARPPPRLPHDNRVSYSAQSARPYHYVVPQPPPAVAPPEPGKRDGLHVGDVDGPRTKPKSVAEWRDRRSRLHQFQQQRELPDSSVAERRQQRRWDSTRGKQNAGQAAERAAAELRELFAAHAPDRLTYVPSLLIQWEGREQELLGKVRHRYRVGIDKLEAEVAEQRCRELREAAREAYENAKERLEQLAIERQRHHQLDDEAGSVGASAVGGVGEGGGGGDQLQRHIQEELRAQGRLDDRKEQYEQAKADAVAAARRREDTAKAFEVRQARREARRQQAVAAVTPMEAAADGGGMGMGVGVGVGMGSAVGGLSASMSSIASSGGDSIFDVLATPRSRPLPEASQRQHCGLMARLDRSAFLKVD